MKYVLTLAEEKWKQERIVPSYEDALYWASRMVELGSTEVLIFDFLGQFITSVKPEKSAITHLAEIE